MKLLFCALFVAVFAITGLGQTSGGDPVSQTSATRIAIKPTSRLVTIRLGSKPDIVIVGEIDDVDYTSYLPANRSKKSILKYHTYILRKVRSIPDVEWAFWQDKMLMVAKRPTTKWEDVSSKIISAMGSHIRKNPYYVVDSIQDIANLLNVSKKDVLAILKTSPPKMDSPTQAASYSTTITYMTTASW